MIVAHPLRFFVSSSLPSSLLSFLRHSSVLRYSSNISSFILNRFDLEFKLIYFRFIIYDKLLLVAVSANID